MLVSLGLTDGFSLCEQSYDTKPPRPSPPTLDMLNMVKAIKSMATTLQQKSVVMMKQLNVEYFPNFVRYAKDVEFIDLVQGSMSVVDYAKKFKNLGRFYTLPMDEE